MDGRQGTGRRGAGREQAAGRQAGGQRRRGEAAGSGFWRRLGGGSVQHFLVAGPICGVLSALYGTHLARIAPGHADAALHATIRQVQSFHGHFLRAYFITPEQNALWWGLSVPAMLWLLAVTLGMAALGVRAHLRGD